MREHVKIEVAFEILAMRIAIAIEKNDLEEVSKLKKERDMLYKADKNILNRIYNKYSKEVKAKTSEYKSENEGLEEVKKQYLLSEDEFEEMYKKAKELIIGNSKPAEGTPIAIVTGGQPGAGKIGLVLEAKKSLMNKGIDSIVIDGDTYRSLYKNAIELAGKYPELYSEITDKATGKITKRLLKELINQGYNFIFEGVMGKTNIIDSLQEAPRKYDITARLMATDRAESLLSIFERYIVMLESMGIGRLATIEAHDIRYTNFTEVAKKLEDRNIEVEVYERTKSYNQIENPVMIYKTSGERNKYGTVEEALNEGRNKSYASSCFYIRDRLKQINKDLSNLSEKNFNIKKELESLNKILSDNNK